MKEVRSELCRSLGKETEVELGAGAKPLGGSVEMEESTPNKAEQNCN